MGRSAVRKDVEAALAFQSAFEGMIKSYVTASRWIPSDVVHEVLALRPHLEDLRNRVNRAIKRGVPSVINDAERAAIKFLGSDHGEIVRSINEQILTSEMANRRDFFDRVEKSPLTDEQARAVVTYESRLRVIAAAGSGKTSVMVARAAYAISRGFTSPDRILMLAFNASAAEELSERVRDRLDVLGLSSEGLRASTFHAFGRSVIGEATNRKPAIAPWVESGKEEKKIMDFVDGLRDSSVDFRYKWDAFRLLYGRMSDSPDGGETDSYDRKTQITGFATFKGDTVRSEGERLIADWLFLNGVDYQYERSYSHDVADAQHAQYRPDFFYPSAGVWHEHWALRSDGTPPPAFVGYAESMAWKKEIHKHFGTRLIETRWYEIIDLSGFNALARNLAAEGIELDWNPDREIPGAQPLEHDRLVRLVRTFMSLVKAGGLTKEQLAARASEGNASARDRLFLDIYWQIHEQWEAELSRTQTIDFDDMLGQAADILLANPHLARYDLVLVDEFQDTSRVRARLTKALTQGRGTHLLAVGDDWQAINRFAGADLGTMTNFDEYFGSATTSRLETTFRCTQLIADVSARFVTQNPQQLAKQVRAVPGPAGVPVTVIRVPSKAQLEGALRDRLAAMEELFPGESVDVLGRYNFDRQLLPKVKYASIDVTFRTVHGAKGLEADHVIVPNMTSGTYGFPSQIVDDPVLRMVLAGDDDFPHAEERRLFYVALTRARQSVTLLTVAGLESPFVVELLNDPDVLVTGVTSDEVDVRICVACKQGTMVLRNGPYGEFLGCSRFPKCTNKLKLP
jgi:DNA helicase-4